MENLMERLEKELEEEKMARIKRRRWRRRFMLLMVFGVIINAKTARCSQTRMQTAHPIASPKTSTRS